MLKCPYQDCKGHDLFVGDKLMHPINKRTFVIHYDYLQDEHSRWRAIYENGDNLWLGQQVDKTRGMASKIINGEHK